MTTFAHQILDDGGATHVSMGSEHMLTKDRRVTDKIKELCGKGRMHIGENLTPHELETALDEFRRRRSIRRRFARANGL